MGATNGRVGDSNGHAREIDQKQGYELLDRLTRQYVGLTAKEFIDYWRAGKYRDREEDPEIARLAMLIPIAS